MPGVVWRSSLVGLAGGAVGGVAAVIVAWNVSIFLVVPGGYEAGISEVFAHSPMDGLLWLAALISGPLVGVVAARRQRQKSGGS